MAKIQKYHRRFGCLLALLASSALPLGAQQLDYNFDSLARVIREKPGAASSIDAYVDFAGKFFYFDRDSALYYLKRADTLAQKNNSPRGRALCLKNMGDVYSINGDFRTARDYYIRGIGVARSIPDKSLVIRMSCNLGMAYKNLGKMDSAMITLSSLGTVFRDNTRTHQDSVSLALYFIQLFDVYRALDFVDDAIYYGEKGYNLSRTLGLQRGIGYGLYIEGLKYSKIDPKLAMRSCEKALAIAESKNIAELQVFARSLKADIYIASKDYRAAENELLPDLRFTAGSIQVVTQSRLARVYYCLQDYTKALRYFQQAIRAASDLGYDAETSNALETGIAIYEKLGDYRTAYGLLKRYGRLKEAMASERQRLDYERSALKFQTEEKDKQLASTQMILEQKDSRLNRQSQAIIAILLIGTLVIVIAWLIYRQKQKLQAQRIRNLEAAREIQMLEAAMNAEERERQRIAKDLHDGLGGILSAIKMRFSALRNEHSELRVSKAYSKAISMLDEASAEIRKTAHNLMPDTLNRWGLDEALHLFCSNVSLSNELRITYQSVGEIGRFNRVFELTIYRMVQELINNIIKHSKAENAYVQLSRQEGLLAVSVEDDGQGFDIRELEDTKGIGLNSIMSRIRSMGGTMDIDTIRDNGTCIYFELDIADLKPNPQKAVL